MSSSVVLQQLFLLFLFMYACIYVYLMQVLSGKKRMSDSLVLELQAMWVASYSIEDFWSISSVQSLSALYIHTYIHTTFSLCVCLSTHVEVRRQLTGISSLSPTWVPEMKTQIIRCDGKSSWLLTQSPVPLLLIIWDRISHWTLRLVTWLVWLASNPLGSSSVLGLPIHSNESEYLGSNSGPFVYAACGLPTELFLYRYFYAFEMDLYIIYQSHFP